MRIKSCEENLLKALKACAEAHNAEFENWMDEGQVGIHKESIPVLADVRAILSAFYPAEYALPDYGYGYVTVYIYGSEVYLPEVNEMILLMALPFGLDIDWVRE